MFLNVIFAETFIPLYKKQTDLMKPQSCFFTLLFVKVYVVIKS